MKQYGIIITSDEHGDTITLVGDGDKEIILERMLKIINTQGTKITKLPE